MKNSLVRGEKMIVKSSALFLIIILAFVFLISCTPAEKSCNADNDCLPAQCCHTADAVNKENSPDCSGVLCTTDCQPGTIDCGQGEIKCVSGECKAVMK